MIDQKTYDLMFYYRIEMEHDEDENLLVKFHNCGYISEITKVIDYLKEAYGFTSAYLYCIESEDGDCVMKVLFGFEEETENAQVNKLFEGEE